MHLPMYVTLTFWDSTKQIESGVVTNKVICTIYPRLCRRANDVPTSRLVSTSSRNGAAGEARQARINSQQQREKRDGREEKSRRHRQKTRTTAGRGEWCPAFAGKPTSRVSSCSRITALLLLPPPLCRSSTGALRRTETPRQQSAPKSTPFFLADGTPPIRRLHSPITAGNQRQYTPGEWGQLIRLWSSRDDA